MAIITISRGCISNGKAIAEKLAEKLGYQCLARDVIVGAAQEFNIPENTLMRALHDRPSVMERFTYAREKTVAYIQHAFYKHIKQDNIVYHGLAGHFFLRDAPNVLKVRIVAKMEDRVKEEMKRNNVTEHEAKQMLTKDDNERRQWSQHLYGVDTWDAGLYDMVVRVDKLTIDDAVDLIYQASQRPCFQSTDESKVFLENLYTAAKIQAILIDHYPTVHVTCKNDIACISCKGALGNDEAKLNSIRELLKDVKEVKEIKFNLVPIFVPD
jgi:cytidylate kinase